MMAARTCGIRRLSGFTTLMTQTLAALALGGIALAAESEWSYSSDRSVLMEEAHDDQLAVQGRGVSAADQADATGLFSVSCTGEAVCGPADCQCGDCRAGRRCRHAGRCGHGDRNQPGLLQILNAIHEETGACWSGRADALLLWRNAPPYRPIAEGGLDGLPRLNADGMDSTPAAGPRLSLIRTDRCGNALEATWLRAANFRSQRPLPLSDQQYVLSNPGIYGNGASQAFDSGFANLGSRIQSFELNGHVRQSPNLRWLVGVRWVEWQEQFTLQDTLSTVAPPIDDFYQTGCINSMYGGQIGADIFLLSLPWLRIDSVVKAGAYYNNAVQSSFYSTTDPANPGSSAIAIKQSPAGGAFIGEVGLTGVMPITKRLNFRFGYFGLWLSGIAQPTQQLSGQVLNPLKTLSGTLNTNGGVVVQGMSLGLEGRW